MCQSARRHPVYHIICFLLKTNIHVMCVQTLFLIKSISCIVCCFICFGLCLRTDTTEENCALLGYYTVSIGNFLPTFQDNIPVPSSVVKNPKRKPGVPIWGLYREEYGWRLPVRFIQVVGRERECGSFEERHSMRKEILTSVVARNIYMREVGERKGKESSICD